MPPLTFYPPGVRAFTTEADGIANVLKNEVQIFEKPDITSTVGKFIGL